MPGLRVGNAAGIHTPELRPVSGREHAGGSDDEEETQAQHRIRVYRFSSASLCLCVKELRYGIELERIRVRPHHQPSRTERLADRSEEYRAIGGFSRRELGLH